MTIQLPSIAYSVFQLFPDAYMVGGAVRDLLIDKMPADYDFATELRPERVMELLEAAKLPVIPIGVEFGTVGTIINSTKVEITTFRCKESYTKGSRKPEVVLGKTIEEDLSRRDFTMNAMAVGWSGKLIDPYGGLIDLLNKRIRTPISAVESFKDDPLRMLRVARFMSRMDPPGDVVYEIYDAAYRLRHEITTVSGERCKAEMDKILMGAAAPWAINWLANVGVLDEMLPTLHEAIYDERPQGRYHNGTVWSHTLDVLAQGRPQNAMLGWAMLLHDCGKPRTRTETLLHGTAVGEEVVTVPHYYEHDAVGAKLFEEEIAPRMKFSVEEREAISKLIDGHMRPHDYSSKWSDGTVRRLVRDFGLLTDDLLVLARADAASHAEPFATESVAAVEALAIRVKEAQTAKFAEPLLPRGLGDAIQKAFALPPSKEVGNLKDRVEEAIIDSKLPRDSSVGECVEYLVRLTAPWPV